MSAPTHSVRPSLAYSHQRTPTLTEFFSQSLTPTSLSIFALTILRQTIKKYFGTPLDAIYSVVFCATFVVWAGALMGYGGSANGSIPERGGVSPGITLVKEYVTVTTTVQPAIPQFTPEKYHARINDARQFNVDRDDQERVEKVAKMLQAQNEEARRAGRNPLRMHAKEPPVLRFEDDVKDAAAPTKEAEKEDRKGEAHGRKLSKEEEIEWKRVIERLIREEREERLAKEAKKEDIEAYEVGEENGKTAFEEDGDEEQDETQPESLSDETDDVQDEQDEEDEQETVKWAKKRHEKNDGRVKLRRTAPREKPRRRAHDPQPESREGIPVVGRKRLVKETE